MPEGQNVGLWGSARPLNELRMWSPAPSVADRACVGRAPRSPTITTLPTPPAPHPFFVLRCNAAAPHRSASHSEHILPGISKRRLTPRYRPRRLRTGAGTGGRQAAGACACDAVRLSLERGDHVRRAKRGVGHGRQRSVGGSFRLAQRTSGVAPSIGQGTAFPPVSSSSGITCLKIPLSRHTRPSGNPGRGYLQCTGMTKKNGWGIVLDGIPNNRCFEEVAYHISRY